MAAMCIGTEESLTVGQAFQPDRGDKRQAGSLTYGKRTG